MLIGTIIWREQVPLGDLVRSPMSWTLVAGMTLASWFFPFVFREKAKWFRAEREGILRRRRLRGLYRSPRLSSDRVTSGHRRAGLRACGALLVTLCAIGLVWVVVLHLAARTGRRWGSIVFLGLLGTIGVRVIREARRWSRTFRERRERRQQRRLQ